MRTASDMDLKWRQTSFYSFDFVVYEVFVSKFMFLGQVHFETRYLHLFLIVFQSSIFHLFLRSTMRLKAFCVVLKT